MSNSMRVLLFVSLAVNLLVVGAIVGAKFAGVRVERAGQSGEVVERLPGPRAFMAALPPETRAKLRDALTASWTQTRQLRGEARQAHIDAFVVASQEPYDVERVRQAFAHMRSADQAALGVFHDSAAQALAQMSPAERRVALEAWRNAQPVRRGPRQQGRGQQGPRGDNQPAQPPQ